ncbi:hypothetical protein PR048_007718 [Dryococelus australis]|uniref:Uncharacterized protein n=1 Tax=Dryococelus australis TaxID=614101 RepID=A0ABQ9HVX3_9NEOP|nr:hypothetical protein PR048_007718 [Dryococelus australis]
MRVRPNAGHAVRVSDGQPIKLHVIEVLVPRNRACELLEPGFILLHDERKGDVKGDSALRRAGAAFSGHGRLKDFFPIDLLKPVLVDTVDERRLCAGGRQPRFDFGFVFFGILAVQQFSRIRDKLRTFEIDLRKMSLALPAYILTGALSDMRPVKLVTMKGHNADAILGNLAGVVGVNESNLLGSLLSSGAVTSGLKIQKGFQDVVRGLKNELKTQRKLSGQLITEYTQAGCQYVKEAGWIMLLWNAIAAFVRMIHDTSLYDTTLRTTALNSDVLRVDDAKKGEHRATPEYNGGLETGDPRENPPITIIVRHDSRMQKSGSDTEGNRNRLALVEGEYPDHYSTAAPAYSRKNYIRCRVSFGPESALLFSLTLADDATERNLRSCQFIGESVKEREYRVVYLLAASSLILSDIHHPPHNCCARFQSYEYNAISIEVCACYQKGAYRPKQREREREGIRKSTFDGLFTQRMLFELRHGLSKLYRRPKCRSVPCLSGFRWTFLVCDDWAIAPRRRVSNLSKGTTALQHLSTGKGDFMNFTKPTNRKYNRVWLAIISTQFLTFKNLNYNPFTVTCAFSNALLMFYFQDIPLSRALTKPGELHQRDTAPHSPIKQGQTSQNLTPENSGRQIIALSKPPCNGVEFPPANFITLVGADIKKKTNDIYIKMLKTRDRRDDKHRIDSVDESRQSNWEQAGKHDLVYAHTGKKKTH